MGCSVRRASSGLGTDHEGILALATDAAPGTPLLDALAVGDTRLVMDVMPNRPDLLSHRGLAREIAAATGRPCAVGRSLLATWSPCPISHAAIARRRGRRTRHGRRPVRLPDVRRSCLPRCQDRPEPGVAGQPPRDRGIERPVNNVVDVTNYLLHGYGQPTHAFDLARLAGREVRVRRARAGERLTTLDGVARALRYVDARDRRWRASPGRRRRHRRTG